MLWFYLKYGKSVFMIIQDVMVTLLAGGLLLGLIIVALCFFGAFKSQYVGLPYF